MCSTFCARPLEPLRGARDHREGVADEVVSTSSNASGFYRHILYHEAFEAGHKSKPYCTVFMHIHARLSMYRLATSAHSTRPTTSLLLLKDTRQGAAAGMDRAKQAISALQMFAER